MTPLRRKMREDMQIRNFAPSTQKGYLWRVGEIADTASRYKPLVLCRFTITQTEQDPLVRVTYDQINGHKRGSRNHFQNFKFAPTPRPPIQHVHHHEQQQCKNHVDLADRRSGGLGDAAEDADRLSS